MFAAQEDLPFSPGRYRERPTQDGEVAHSMDRMIAGKQQIADVTVAIECRQGAGPVQLFFDEAAKAELDGETEEAIREGILAACARGVLEGHPIVDAAVFVRKVDR
jgi:hypothetical protein